MNLAIVDYEIGNLYSVQRACEIAGMSAVITRSKQEILDADGVILPGVGAFGDAMDSLRRFDLVSPIRDVVHMGRPLVGVCLGLQLLMTESEEFGSHRGLDIIPGVVRRLPQRENLKVPQVGWNQIDCPPDRDWHNTALRRIPEQTFMYFVHSYYVQPDDPSVVLSTTRYGGFDFCSSVECRNLFACQFHPERSGPTGIRVYESIRASIADGATRENSDVKQ